MKKKTKCFFALVKKQVKAGRVVSSAIKHFMKKLNTITEERGLFLPLCCYWQLRAWAW